MKSPRSTSQAARERLIRLLSTADLSRVRVTMAVDNLSARVWLRKGYSIDLESMVAVYSGIGRLWGAIGEAREKIRQARIALRRTPRVVSVPVEVEGAGSRRLLREEGVP